jgi:hypothetical protein
MHIFPPKIPFRFAGLDSTFPPEIDRPLTQLRGIENMSERFSVCRGTLSPFVGDKLPWNIRRLKQFVVSIPAKRSQIRT